MFTKEKILKMKEEEFQNTVLIPLFRAMKFHDVTAFGGGSLERGKDIVMWKESDLGQRINFGVVVKAKKITGNAETSDGAMNVLNQIRQMLKTSYVNPVSGESERIHRCYVACSKEITKEAMNSIEGELENNLDKLVEWLHPGTNLYDIIEYFLPHQTIFEKLASSQKHLDEIMKDAPYRIVATTENEFIFKTKPDHPESGMPFRILYSDRPEDESKVLKAKADLIESQKTGKHVKIVGDFIQLDIPHLPDFMKPSQYAEATLILQSVPTGYKLPASIEIESANGEKELLHYVCLEPIQQGTEEIVYTNVNQNVPWTINVTLGFTSQNCQIDFNFNSTNSNSLLCQELLWLKFLRKFNQGGKITIRHLEIDRVIFEGNVPFISADFPLNDWVKILEALSFIEQKVRTVFINNSLEEIPVEEVNHILGVARLIKFPEQEFGFAKIQATFPIDLIKAIKERFEDREIRQILGLSEDIKTEVWGKEINLGKRLVVAEGFMEENELKNLEEQLEGKNMGEIEFEILLDSSQKSKVYYLKFLSPEQRTELEKIVPPNVLESDQVGLLIKV